tara:strand:- start:683 stop:1222 length:540 start_codon:yes stop_codon:yes gene_type:complete
MNLEPIVKTSAVAAAKRHSIPSPLVLAMIVVESAGNTFATRFESHYRYCWNMRSNQPFTARGVDASGSTAPSGFPGFGGMSANTEWVFQKTSWGLLQLMGANARAYGFREEMPRLCKIDLGLEYGCLHLARCRDRWLKSNGWAGVLDAYNDGNGAIEYKRDYPHKVAEVSIDAREILGL